MEKQGIDEDEENRMKKSNTVKRVQRENVVGE